MATSGGGVGNILELKPEKNNQITEQREHQSVVILRVRDHYSGLI